MLRHNKFIHSQKLAINWWKDHSFELKTYLHVWLSELEIEMFEGLEVLMIAN